MGVNPPESRKITIHNLSPNTKYVFQVIGTNEYGDGMYSEIIEAQTKGESLDCVFCFNFGQYLQTYQKQKS